MSELDPPRPADDPDDPLGALFRAGREVPKDRIASVGARLDAPGASGGPRVDAGRGWLRIGVGLAVLALGAAGLWGTTTFRSPSTASPVIAPSVEAPHGVAAPLEAPLVEALQVRPEEAGPEEALDEEALHARNEESSEEARAPRVVRREPALTPPAEAEVAPVVAPAADAPSEFVLIARARRMLDRDPESAGSALREHARLYPDGMLVEEREALEVEWLVVSGRRAEAEAARARFERAHPGSAHRARIENRFEHP